MSVNWAHYKTIGPKGIVVDLNMGKQSDRVFLCIVFGVATFLSAWVFEFIDFRRWLPPF